MTNKMASFSQIRYCRDLIRKLGYDEMEITEGAGVDGLSCQEVSSLISELKDEYEG